MTTPDERRKEAEDRVKREAKIIAEDCALNTK